MIKTIITFASSLLLIACAMNANIELGGVFDPDSKKLFVVQSAKNKSENGSALLNQHLKYPMSKHLDERLKSVLNADTDQKSVVVDEISIRWVDPEHRKRSAAAMGGLVGIMLYDSMGEGRKDSIVCEIRGAYKQHPIEVNVEEPCPTGERYCFGTLSNPIDVSLSRTQKAIQKVSSQCLDATVESVKQLKLKAS